ncbi:MAG: hypothetical protein ACXIU7_06780 [Roseinatronobacter sp.]
MRQFRFFLGTACLALAGLLASPPAARAQTLTQDPTAERVFQISPYAWATGMGATLRPFTGAPTVTVDKSFSDLLRDLDAAFFLSVYARQGNLVFLGDLSTSSSSRAGDLSPPSPIPVSASATLRQTSLTALAGVRALAGAEGTLDLLGGARYWRVRGGVDVAALGAARTVSFTDPVIAARANLNLGPGWSALIYADLGGFGIGSRRSAQLLGTLNYQWRENTFLSLGYRQLDLDYRSGGTRFDVRMSGPLLGATLRF